MVIWTTGKHEASSGESGESSSGSRRDREFTRTYTLQEDMDPDTVTSSLTGKVLTITVKKRLPEGEPRVVDIEDGGDGSD